MSSNRAAPDIIKEDSSAFSIDLLDEDDSSFEEEVEEEEQVMANNAVTRSDEHDDDGDSFDESVIEEATPLTMLENRTHRMVQKGSSSNNATTYAPLPTRSDKHDGESSVLSASTDGSFSVSHCSSSQADDFSVSVASEQDGNTAFSQHHMEKKQPAVVENSFASKKGWRWNESKEKYLEWPAWSSWSRKADESAGANTMTSKPSIKSRSVASSTKSKKSIVSSNDKTPKVTNRKSLSPPKTNESSTWMVWGSKGVKKEEIDLSSTSSHSVAPRHTAARRKDAKSISSKDRTVSHSNNTQVADQAIPLVMGSASNGVLSKTATSNTSATDFQSSQQPKQDNGASSTSSRNGGFLSKLTKSRKKTKAPMRNIDDISAALDDWSPSISSAEAKGARQLIVDIESGSRSSSSWQRQQGHIKQANAVRTKKCVLALAVMIILTGITAGTLIHLNIFPGKSGLPLGGSKDTASPVAEGEPDHLSGEPWYANWNMYQCVQDCDGPSPSCGGPRPSWEKPYNSLKECCQVNFEGYIGEHWTLDECMSTFSAERGNIGGGGKGGGGGMQQGQKGNMGISDTTWPTPTPTTDSQDEDDGANSQDEDNKSSPSPTPKPTKRRGRPPQMVQNKPDKGSSQLYYADWDISKCMIQDSSDMKPWDTGYKTEEECCQYNFGWDVNSDCYTGTTGNESEDESKDQVTESSSPVQTPQSELAEPASPPQAYQEASTNKDASMMYYANRDQSKCIEQDSGTKKSWDTGYESEEDCCHQNFGWDEKSDCYVGNDDIDNDTAAVSSPAPSSSDVDNNAKTSTKTPTSSTPTSSPVPTKMMYFPNFDEGKCIQESSSGMNGLGTRYETEDECCQENFQQNVNSYCYNGADDESGIDSSNVATTTTSPSVVESTSNPITAESTPSPSTAKPSSQAPTGASVSIVNTEMMYYPHWETGKCIERDSSTMRRWDTGYAAQEQCCKANFGWKGDNECSSTGNSKVVSSTPAPSVQSDPVDTAPGSDGNNSTAIGEMLYFANFNMGRCVQEDSSQKQPWEKSYHNENDCCLANFGWSKTSGCYAGDMKYYADLDARQCVRKDSSTQRWATGYDTEDECCEGNFSWDKDGGCYANAVNDDTDPSKTPTPAPIMSTEDSPSPDSNTSVSISTIVDESDLTRSNNATTFSPSAGNPTLIPTYFPTKVPSFSLTSHPSRNPILNPTTAKPTVVASLSPTRKPSPSPTPIERLEQLQIDLKTISPLSSNSLDDDRSDQYRAMEWLVDNANFDAYSAEQRVQRWVLATFYNALYGREWSNTSGWMRDTNECEWHSITCDDAGMVTSIEMSQNNLWGAVPFEVSLFGSIESLRLSMNFISDFSSAVFSLPNLIVLDLDKNIIEEIPSGINPSSGLKELYLSNNEITSLPDELFQLQHVTNIWLSNNKIASPLPSGLGAMVTLEELDLESNYFTGSIPSELFSLVNLQTLSLHDNILTGPFSSQFSQMTSLRVLDLDTNYISGEIPTDIGLISQLSELHLGDNELVGQLPWAQISDLVDLTHLDVSQNYLNSTIGSEIGSLVKLVSLQLDNNYRFDDGGNLLSYGMQGPIPGSIGSLSQLQELRLDNNFVGGAIPATIGNLQSLVTLRLESNNLQSSIPSTLGNLSNLQYLHLWSNYLSSSISGQIGRLGQLRELFLDDNELTGQIPYELGQLSSATYISFADNNLDGILPPTFGSLASLQRLDVQFNFLYGELPRQMANIPLAKIKLEGNYFYGDIPDGVCQNVQYLSANCASTRRPTGAPTTKPASFQGLSIADSDQNDVPTASPTFEYWWSCNCCTTCSN